MTNYLLGLATIPTIIAVTAAAIFAFYSRAPGPQGCNFQRTGYGAQTRLGLLPVVVCEWCTRTAFETTPGELPKSSRCSRHQFGLGDLAAAAIQTATLGMMKAPECSECEKRKRAMNQKLYFMARPWVRRAMEFVGIVKRVPKPWNNPNYGQNKFVKLEG